MHKIALVLGIIIIGSITTGYTIGASAQENAIPTWIKNNANQLAYGLSLTPDFLNPIIESAYLVCVEKEYVVTDNNYYVQYDLVQITGCVDYNPSTGETINVVVKDPNGVIVHDSNILPWSIPEDIPEYYGMFEEMFDPDIKKVGVYTVDVIYGDTKNTISFEVINLESMCKITEAGSFVDVKIDTEFNYRGDFIRVYGCITPAVTSHILSIYHENENKIFSTVFYPIDGTFNEDLFMNNSFEWEGEHFIKIEDYNGDWEMTKPLTIFSPIKGPLPEPMPSWTESIFVWFDENLISEQELLAALDWLTDNGIIVIYPPSTPPKDNTVIEEEGVLLIKDTQEYKTLIDEYGEDFVSVKATNLLEVEDALFLREIDDGFKQNSGCIIVLEYENDQGYIYQLDKELNIVYRMNLLDFTESANKINSQIMEDFYKSLK